MARIPNLQSPHDDGALNIHNEVIDQMNSHLKKYNDLAEDTQQLISETEEYLSDTTEEQKDKYRALYERADYLQDNAQAIYEMNQDVQQMLDNIVLESGTSDAELVQARGDYALLKDRLDYYDDEVEQTKNKIDNLSQFQSITYYIPTDFSDLQSAIDKISERKLKHGVIIDIMFETEYVINTSLLLRSGEYSHIQISSEDETVLLSDDFGDENFAEFINCSSPVLNTVIDGNGLSTVGWKVDNASRSTINGGCGFINASSHNLYVSGGSVVFAQDAIFTGGSQSSDGSTSGGGSGITSWGAITYAEGADVSGSLNYGAQAAHGGTLNFRNGNANDCGRHAVRATNSSNVDARSANIEGAGVHGVYALSDSTVNAYGSSCINAGGSGLKASQGSLINARECDVSGSYRGVEAERSSTIEFRSGIANDCENNGINVSGGSRLNAWDCEVMSSGRNGVVSSSGSTVVLNNCKVTDSNTVYSDLYINSGSHLISNSTVTTNSEDTLAMEEDTNVDDFNQPFSYFGIIWVNN